LEAEQCGDEVVSKKRETISVDDKMNEEEYSTVILSPFCNAWSHEYPFQNVCPPPL
jgi:hypothetical protein